MATAIGNTTNHRYYCHSCEENISPTIPEFTCPGCHTGFIEEVNGDDNMDVEEPGGHMFNTENEIAFGSVLPRNHEAHRRIGTLNVRRYPRRTQHHVRRRPSNMPHDHLGHFTAVDHVLRHFGLDRLFSAGEEEVPGEIGFLNLFTGNIHGNPGDYVWGGQGVDSVITRFLEQMEGSGPPPADPSQIAALPTVTISQNDVDVNLECPVCKELFVLNEEATKLPCNHYFHESCITPWLEKHDSCPICRLSLNGSKTNAEN